jgi:His/Glu/Gln/Arg/opine family amino acid ABC transporter permease subunit
MTTAQWMLIIAQGAVTTLKVFTVTLLLSTVLALPLALARVSILPLALPSLVYIWIFRGLPELLILFFVYFGLPFLGINISAFLAVIVGFTLWSTAYIAEAYRAGLESVPPIQHEAARALGMKPSVMYRRIILPQALPIAVPPYINQAIDIVKRSALASVVGVSDITANARAVMTITFNPFAVFAFAALLYMIITSGLAVLQRWLEKRLVIRR